MDLSGWPRTPLRTLPSQATVLGLGRTGVAAALYLSQKGVDVVASDRSQEPGPQDPVLREAGVAVVRGSHPIREGELVVISPGIPPHTEVFRRAHKLGSDVISGPELYATTVDVPVVAITGTDGKSTVTTWIADLLDRAGLRVHVGGNLGIPMVELVDEAPPDVAVIEISAFQLLTTPTLRPAIGVVTNVVDDHLDYFQGDAVAYRASKRLLVERLGPGSLFIALAEDPVVSTWSVPAGVGIRTVALSPSAHAGADEERVWLWDKGEKLPVVEATELKLPGQHNRLNAAMVSLVGQAMDVEASVLKASLRSYGGLPHRCEWVGTHGGVRFVNDSKATSPHATMAALGGLDGELILLVGGSDKHVSFQELGKKAMARTKCVVAYGQTGPALKEAMGATVRVVTGLEEAFTLAMDLAVSGDTLLLSPACASFDQYGSYQERGEHFKELVERVLRS